MPCSIGNLHVTGFSFTLTFAPSILCTGHARADGDGIPDVQAERVRLPQHERCRAEEQTHEHDA